MLSIFISPINIINAINVNVIHRHILSCFSYNAYLIIIGIYPIPVYTISFLLKSVQWTLVKGWYM